MYYEYLKAMLAPLRLYKLDEGYGAEELRLAGGRLDGLQAELDVIERESILTTAVGYGLDAYEEILPYRPLADSENNRKKALAALLRIDGRSFTLDALRDTLRGCGVKINLREGSVHQTVVVTFPGTKGTPEDFESLSKRVEQILPCHLGIIYEFAFITWILLEGYFPTWALLDGAELSWRELELKTPLMEGD